MKTNIGLRKKILKLSAEGLGYTEIAQQTGTSYYQVWNIVNGRVKTNYSERKDKGYNRSSEEDTPITSAAEFETVEGYLRHVIYETINDINNNEKLSIDKKIRMLKDLTILQTKLKELEMESWIKTPQAQLVIRIMRRLKPELSDDEILTIYNEEREKYLNGTD